jgi:Fungal specific transcription factor domain
MSLSHPNEIQEIYPSLSSPEQHSLFIHFINQFSPLLVRPHAHPGFADHSYIFSLALGVPALMDVFLACSAIHLSENHPRMESIAMKHYSSAVTVLRKLIDEKEVDGTEDWLLTMAIFLCLFEVSEIHLPPPFYSSHSADYISSEMEPRYNKQGNISSYGCCEDIRNPARQSQQVSYGVNITI